MLPSPASRPSAAFFQDADNIAIQSHTLGVTSNGLPTEAAVHYPFNIPTETNLDHFELGSVARRTEVIQEGKQKARAIVAANALNAPPFSGAMSPTTMSKHSTTGQTEGQNLQQGRKRSRSGSRLPVHTIPAHSSSATHSRLDLLRLEQYKERDISYNAALKSTKDRQTKLLEEKEDELRYWKDNKQWRMKHPGEVFAYGYAGHVRVIRKDEDGAERVEGYILGNERTDGMARVMYTSQRKPASGRRTRAMRVPRKDMALQAEQMEELVPVRLDIEFDKIKLRDTFTWNLNDRTVTPRLFAQTLIEDFKLPPEQSDALVQQVENAIQEQIQDFYPHVYDNEQPLDLHLPYFAYKNDEMRILIKLNITIGQHTLVDQFEWDVNSAENCAEDFARQMASDLSLSGEFTTAIAHSIREQCQLFTKSLYITGHPFDGRVVEDADVRDAFLQSPLPSVFRPAQSAKDYTPYLFEISETDLEKTELAMSRELRRQKRSVNRRGGPALPDLKDRQRTVRTQVVSKVLPGGAETVEQSGIYKITRSASGRVRRPGRADGSDDSDGSLGDESPPDSPAMSTNMAFGGTARTRGMRGAASAAQAAMRGIMGRSATPELASLHHHETRTSLRRFGGVDYREESVAEPTSLIVKFKLPRERYRQWWRDWKAARQRQAQQGHLSTPFMQSKSTTPQQGTPGPGSMGPPPTTPRAHGTQPPGHSSGFTNPQQQGQQGRSHYHRDGRLDAPTPPIPGQPGPSPPSWLNSALQTLHQKYPHDSFEATMRYTQVDPATLGPVKPDQPPPSNAIYQYLPRIRCNDCPGKLYTAGPDLTVENFEVHLKNRVHKERVDARRRGHDGSASGNR